jgi:predicted small lipoprotein YifL
MFRDPITRLRGAVFSVAAAAAIAAVALGGCGVRGPLRLPPASAPESRPGTSAAPSTEAPGTPPAQPDERKP